MHDQSRDQCMIARLSLHDQPRDQCMHSPVISVHILLKPGLENFEHYFTSVCDECNCAVV